METKTELSVREKIALRFVLLAINILQPMTYKHELDALTDKIKEELQ